MAPSRQSPSAIGAYTAEILDRWQRVPASHVELLEDDSDTDLRPEPGRWLSSAIGPFRHAYEFDHLVSVLGSSGFHLSTALVAERQPTHVWLHEASLAGCYLNAAVKSSSEEWARSFIATRSERGSDFYSLEPEDFHREGVTLLGPVLRSARSAIVSSHEAAEVIRRAHSDCPPLLVLPLAYPEVPTAVDVPVRRIVSAGWLAFNKRPGVLVHLAKELHVEVEFVGPEVPMVAEHVRTLVVDLGVADLVRLSGRVDDNLFHRTLASARLGVQLRTGSIGQRSAAINDLIARGIPVVTNLVSTAESTNAIRAVDVTALDDRTAAHFLAPIVAELLDDDGAWRAASQSAIETARSWTYDDVVRVVDRWLDRAESFPHGSVHTVESFT